MVALQAVPPKARTETCSISTLSLSAPGSPASTSFTSCASSDSRCERSRPGPESAALGTGPLSGRPLRFRKLDLRLLVLAGAARRVGLGGAFRRPARDRALPQLRGRQVRLASRRPVQEPSGRRALSREHAPLDIALEDGRRYTARFLVTAVGVLSAATLPNIPGVKSFAGRRSTPITGRKSRSASPASGWRWSAPAPPAFRQSPRWRRRSDI